jgi:basic amino acid/polyamine antiporter, APA family
VNALTLAGGRAYYAMALDGLFVRGAGQLNDAGVPARALVIQCIWSLILIIPRTYSLTTKTYGNLYSNLLDYVISAALLFYILTVAGLFVLRRKSKANHRGKGVSTFPWLASLYILGASVLLATLLWYRPATTWPGFIIVLSGIPVYLIMRARARRNETASEFA